MEFKKENYQTTHDDNVIRTASLNDLKKAVDYMVNTANINNKCPCDIPVYFNYNGKTYEFNEYSVCLSGGKEMQVLVEFDDYNEIKYVAPDKRPENGEYWQSRGCGLSRYGAPDCSGFVVSKAAGERLRRMVRLILEKDEIESWLDYREREPNWIQFKFSGNEFDVEILDKLAKENNDILTFEILKKCKINKNGEEK